ncbi:MAG: hydroxyacylglutathione hydrolase [Pseudomonadota bacterium]
MSLEISPIPAFEDNYIWVAQRAGFRHCIVVDPGDAAPVLAWLQTHALTPAVILLTHHHYDHVDGVAPILSRFDVPVYGPDDARMPSGTIAKTAGQRVDVPELDARFEVLEVPAHTASHIAFFGHDALFCGDALFSAGCGRLFEGTADDLLQVMDTLTKLPDETRIYCGHEYTQSNCRFALTVEPDNPDLIERTARVNALRQQQQPTLPSTIGAERLFNPFMRVREPSVIKAVQRQLSALPNDPSTIMAAIRQWKDRS